MPDERQMPPMNWMMQKLYPHVGHHIVCVTYGTQQTLGVKTIERLRILLPPLSEQKEIVDYLDLKRDQIDRLIAIKQSKIEKLEQYKKSLIYEYVTGKKEIAG